LAREAKNPAVAAIALSAKNVFFKIIFRGF
jgi:hypothetical protein